MFKGIRMYSIYVHFTTQAYIRYKNEGRPPDDMLVSKFYYTTVPELDDGCSRRTHCR